MNIKYPQELLQQIAAGLNRLNIPVSCIAVAFEVENTSPGDPDSYEFSLAQALDVLANDLYWDERGNWSQARTVRVRAL